MRPGGRLAITTWGERVFEPANSFFWESIREVRPDLYKGFNPWDRICDPASVRAMLSDAGIAMDDVAVENGWHPIRSPGDWWLLVLGTGYRGTVEQLSPAERERVKEANLDFIRRNGVRTLKTSVVYGRAQKG